MTYYGPNYLTWDTHKPEQGGIFILISDCPSHTMYGGPYFYFRYSIIVFHLSHCLHYLVLSLATSQEMVILGNISVIIFIFIFVEAIIYLLNS